MLMMSYGSPRTTREPSKVRLSGSITDQPITSKYWTKVCLGVTLQAKLFEPSVRVLSYMDTGTTTCLPTGIQVLKHQFREVGAENIHIGL